ncbi:menaquinone biosynthesis decarboxylase [Candidatus Oleimmundimicrobium sp.]|uniref:menaquinone biosynthesis decarboxylase n=1 Tax=Candidatus Oleimmundimicrobium sp. TaxID=3060597 RepID=UPI00271E8C5A|nr:menaquinone biosynthesis decarboxylase [Candidatus Oleimmundimicrobium sp.]MDO8885910.1 menaquinone biosynthesis decarboxylase [Candidatus Oleimmundimicrobium sp.]
MAFKDLREFVEFLEKKGELKRVKTKVDPVLEITEITDRVSKKNGPALLFENVKGSDFPVLINTFGSFDRMSWSLGVENLDEIANRIRKIMSTNLPGNLIEKLGALIKLKDFTNYMPKLVKKAPCQEVVLTENFSLEDFPILKCWPGDAGKFITLPLVITKDPVTGQQNMGMYRMQIFDGKTTGMHWHIHHDGAENYRKAIEAKDKFEVAVALGADPATIYSATAPLPKGIDELIFSGFLREEPVDIVKCKTVDLKVPARAEIILEGYVDLNELRREGPFGDHTGYYSLADEYPIFHIQSITHRKNPIYPATIVGRPPMEDCYFGKATERIFLPLIQLMYPEIIEINLPFEGVFHNCVIVSINKSYPLHANKIMNAIWGMGQMMFSKMIVVVDKNVNVHDCSEVAWKIFNNVDPERDIAFTRGPLDVLDHSSNSSCYGSKIGIDATKKWKEEGYPREWPDDIKMDDETKRLVDDRWLNYSIE